HRYNGTFFRGYAAEVTEEIVGVLKNLPEVAYIEQDVIGTISATQANAPWGLRRISQPRLPLPNLYTYPDQGGAGVDVYVVDTGIMINHPEFQGRASIGATFTTENDDNDNNGHGTHVAGIIGGATYGVAKSASLISVKVLPASATGSMTDFVAGISWIGTRAASRPTRRCVINMSIGGPAWITLDNIVEAVTAGTQCVFAVSVGNDNRDACGTSPSRSAAGVRVGATTEGDRKNGFLELGEVSGYFCARGEY
ncbi:peptidase S8/S53 domain-containing protein, partial [Chytridium lagenaria]